LFEQVGNVIHCEEENLREPFPRDKCWPPLGTGCCNASGFPLSRLGMPGICYSNLSRTSRHFFYVPLKVASCLLIYEPLEKSADFDVFRGCAGGWHGVGSEIGQGVLTMPWKEMALAGPVNANSSANDHSCAVLKDLDIDVWRSGFRHVAVPPKLPESNRSSANERWHSCVRHGLNLLSNHSLTRPRHSEGPDVIVANCCALLIVTS
jgi:hypothetical protein